MTGCQQLANIGRWCTGYGVGIEAVDHLIRPGGDGPAPARGSELSDLKRPGSKLESTHLPAPTWSPLRQKKQWVIRRVDGNAGDMARLSAGSCCAPRRVAGGSHAGFILQAVCQVRGDHYADPARPGFRADRTERAGAWDVLGGDGLLTDAHSGRSHVPRRCAGGRVVADHPSIVQVLVDGDAVTKLVRVWSSWSTVAKPQSMMMSGARPP